MKIAIVLTVKNEERILRQNVQYHKAIGAEHIFIYFDNTTDQGKASIADLSYVTVQDSVTVQPFINNKDLEKFTTKAAEHHTARQCLNTFHALKTSEKLGYDWLISIDADELICTSVQAPSNLAAFFNEIPKETDLVSFKTRESLSRRATYSNVFAEETLFKTQPFFGHRFKNIYKNIYNPFTKTNERYSYWFGQHLGKAAIRTNRNVIPKNVHRYQKSTGKMLHKTEKGLVLHYHAYDADDFIKKFTNFSNRPNTFLSGNKVNSLKLLLRDVVNNPELNSEALREYYKKYLLFSPKEIRKLKQNRYLGVLRRNPAPLQEITSVQKVFQTKIRPS